MEELPFVEKTRAGCLEPVPEVGSPAASTFPEISTQSDCKRSFALRVERTRAGEGLGRKKWLGWRYLQTKAD